MLGRQPPCLDQWNGIAHGIAALELQTGRLYSWLLGLLGCFPEMPSAAYYCMLPATADWLMLAGCCWLAAGCWLLAAGCCCCWLLLLPAAGCWLLAAGCWLMPAVGYTELACGLPPHTVNKQCIYPPHHFFHLRELLISESYAP